jgi:hypothetical protein
MSHRPFIRFINILLMLAAGLYITSCASLRRSALMVDGWRPAPEDVASPQGLPYIGKWMINSQYEPAHWLGELYHEKSLREPINIIIVDEVSQSAEEARELLLKNCSAAGYPVREGHSANYHGYIDGILYLQLPEGGHRAFSNEPFELSNNHGRMFGPYRFQGGWLFIGAFSREKIDPLEKMRHRYLSFNQARDDLAQRLELKTGLKIKGFVNLENALIGNTLFTTGDHDGIAVLLTTASAGGKKRGTEAAGEFK